MAGKSMTTVVIEKELKKIKRMGITQIIKILFLSKVSIQLYFYLIKAFTDFAFQMKQLNFICKYLLNFVKVALGQIIKDNNIMNVCIKKKYKK